jgi:8-oxo-dGTP pyrophosphatase MutT (NUDIX family)
VGDGDGWVLCAAGHRHWGRFGAAGLLIVDDGRAVLQHRAPWTHEGGTWSIPGGARDSHEDAVAAALREAGEEAAIAPDGVDPVGVLVDDHGGWSYTTVVARPTRPLEPVAANPESSDVRWWPASAVADLPLHRGFAGAWPTLREPPAPLDVVVDAANVIGSVPNGWWRDRAGATRELLARLSRLAGVGLAAADLPTGVELSALSGLLPRFTVVLEGDARAAAPLGHGPRVVAVPAAGAGDEEIVNCAAAAADRRSQVVVVTADRGLRARLPGSAIAVGPRWLTGLTAAL